MGPMEYDVDILTEELDEINIMLNHLNDLPLLDNKDLEVIEYLEQREEFLLHLKQKRLGVIDNE